MASSTDKLCTQDIEALRPFLDGDWTDADIARINLYYAKLMGHVLCATIVAGREPPEERARVDQFVDILQTRGIELSQWPPKQKSHALFIPETVIPRLDTGDVVAMTTDFIALSHDHVDQIDLT